MYKSCSISECLGRCRGEGRYSGGGAGAGVCWPWSRRPLFAQDRLGPKVNWSGFTYQGRCRGEGRYSDGGAGAGAGVCWPWSRHPLFAQDRLSPTVPRGGGTICLFVLPFTVHDLLEHNSNQSFISPNPLPLCLPPQVSPGGGHTLDEPTLKHPLGVIFPAPPRGATLFPTYSTRTLYPPDGEFFSPTDHGGAQQRGTVER